MRTVEIAPSLPDSNRAIDTTLPSGARVRTANIKDITPRLIDAQTESSCSQLKHLEKQSTALRQMKDGDKQTDIYNLLEE